MVGGMKHSDRAQPLRLIGRRTAGQAPGHRTTSLEYILTMKTTKRNKRGIKGERFRIYFSADNLLTFTKYKYLDPERGGDGAFVAYPQNKVVSLGLNLTY